MIFTKSLAKQLASQGRARERGGAGTDLDAAPGPSGQLPGKMYEFGVDTPMGRAGQPEEFATRYVLLASTEGSYSTGQVFGASGGSSGP